MATPETTCTLESFLAYKNYDKNVYYSDLSIFEKSIDGKGLLLTYNVLNDYIDEILDYVIDVRLTNKEFIKYQYNPKSLAYDLYGSTEYYYIILFLNGMTNIKEFNKHKLKLIRPNILASILSAIYTSESDFLTENQSLLENF